MTADGAEVARSSAGGQAGGVRDAQEPSRQRLAKHTGGPFLTDAEAPVVSIVDADEDKVEADLMAGRLACPDCGGELRPWSHARQRPLRRGTGEERIRPRRAICAQCGEGRGKTHVLCLTRASSGAGTTSR